MNPYLVLPTIRENCTKEFLEQWKEEIDLDHIIVVEDNPNKTFNLNLKHHYSWEDIEKDFGKNNWVISKRDSAIRSYGFLKAYQIGAEYIITLDDDCYRIPEEKLIETHLKKLKNGISKWASSIPEFRTRGLPYDELGTMNNVVLSMGLWTDVPDLDSIQSFANPIKNYYPPECDRILASGQYSPICGMNMAFKREVAVMSYFPIMGLNSPYNRFDDIWFGVIFKKICDHLNLAISVGHPYVRHVRESNKFNNLIKESKGIKLNETFWQHVDSINLSEANPLGCMLEIGMNLESNEDEYISKLGKAIQIWAKFF